MQPHSDRLESPISTEYHRHLGAVDVQDGEAIVGEVLNLLVPAGGLEVAVAPGVVVEGEEIGAHVIGTAVHVHGSLHAVGRDIGSGVADGNLSQAAGVDVVLHVAGDSLDIRGGLVGALLVVDNLVPGEEGQGVVIFGEHLDSGENTLQVGSVVGRVGVLAVDGVFGVIDVEDEVDTSICESLHAYVVVGSVVDSVDTDRVDTERLEVLDVALAKLAVGQRVEVGRGTTRLVVDTTEVESLAISPES